MEPRDHGVEHEADVRPGRGELSLNSTFCVDWGGFARGTTLVGAMAEVSSVNSALRPRVRGRHAGTSDLTHQIYPKNQLRQAASTPRRRSELSSGHFDATWVPYVGQPNRVATSGEVY